jgi:Transposase DDE domain group 1
MRTNSDAKARKPIKIKHSNEKLSNRIGVPLIEELARRFKLREEIDDKFGKQGSNRGIKASDYIMTLVYMIIDGALHLENVRHLMNDEAFQEMLKEMQIPTSEAIGDWLRRDGGKESESKLWEVMRGLLKSVKKAGSILDIDTTIIESDKEDVQKTYKRNYGYHPLLGIIAENSMVVGSDFREGNESPQKGLVEFIESCRRNYPERIKLIRSDSAGWQKGVVDYCEEHSGRGIMEKRIGELKHQLNLNHQPCGQFNANCLYFHCLGLLFRI